MQLVIVLANGVLENTEARYIQARIATERERSKATPLVIAADGGAKHAKSLGLELDYVVGDLDSFDAGSAPLKPKTQIFRFPSEKDHSDLELALRFAAQHLQRDGKGKSSREYAEHLIVILGASGGRLDMTLSNYLLLAHPFFSGLVLQIWNGLETMWLARPPLVKFSALYGQRVSLIPLEPTDEITTQGLLFPLKTEALEFSSSRGVSNRITAESASIEWQSGLIWCIQALESD